MLPVDDSSWASVMKAEIAEIRMRNLGARVHDILGELCTAVAILGLAERCGRASDAGRERVEAHLRQARAMLPRNK